MKQNFFYLAICITLYFGKSTYAQNAITLDPNISGTSQARTLSEGVGSVVDKIYDFNTPTGSQWQPSRLGIKSITTTTSAENVTAIYGLAEKSSTQNFGVYGGAGGEGSAWAYGGRFAAYGNTTSPIFGSNTTVYSSGIGAAIGGYYLVRGRSLQRYGLDIQNTALLNDTTRALSRYGINVGTNGKMFNGNSIYGISSNLQTSNADTVTNNTWAYSIYGNSSIKNIGSNIGITGDASNYGIGNSIGGSFSANYGGVNNANGIRKGLEARAISSNNDTVTVFSRYGVYSQVNGHTKYSNYAVYGENGNVYGDTLTANSRTGVYGTATGKSKYNNYGLYGNATSPGNNTNYGVYGTATSYGGSSVYGIYANAYHNGATGNTYGGQFYAGISPSAQNNYAIFGISAYASGPATLPLNYASISGASIAAYSNGNNDTKGINTYSYGSIFSEGSIKGVYSQAFSDNTNNYNSVYGIYTTAAGDSPGTKYGIYANTGGSGAKYAGYFNGNVHVNGTLSKSGGTFKIDHPQDPENKYLSHSFVESPEMKNIYDGLVKTDANGDATVSMPSYFQSLNISFRYQLTCIGQFAQAIVLEEISNNKFKIKTDKPNVKVSWQVTGVRNDPWALSYPVVVEQQKTGIEKGKFLNPEAYKKTEMMGIHSIANTSHQTAAQREAEANEVQSKMEKEQKQRKEQQARELTQNLKEKAEREQAEQNRQLEQIRREEQASKKQ